MKKIIVFYAFLAVLCFFYPKHCTVSAQIRGENIEVLVTLDREGWNYNLGETAQFKVSVLRSGSLLKNANISYKMGPEMYEDIEKKDVVLKDGTLSLKGSMKRPGFYRLTVNAHVDGKKYEGMATAAFAPEKLTPVTDCPADFDEFWGKALGDARSAAPLNPTRRLLPEKCTEEVNVYEVSFQNIRWNSRTYGILCVPTKPGKYPAVYKVPGAGCRPYEGDPWWAAKGFIVLEIGIHGVPVTQPRDFYTQLQEGPLNCYWNFNIDNRDEAYYKRVVVEAVRGVDFIATLPEWDGENLGVMGSSQGGWLSIVTTALDNRVSCYAPVHPALCDHTASLKGVACGWPHYFYWDKSAADVKAKKYAKEIETVKYYDGVNFAKRIKVPGWFSFGYNDDVVPPTTAYATYNIITAPKEISLYPKTKHFWYQEQYDEWTAWLSAQLTKSPADRLETRLNALAEKGVMFGHQDSPFYGFEWTNIGKAGVKLLDKNDIKDVCGDLPAVMGFDLGGLEYFSQRNIDGVPFDYERQEIIKHHERGGIVTLSWHPINPANGENAWNVKDNPVEKILPGGELNAKFNVWLDELVKFISTLKDKNGNPIPLIFRPWHEMNGGWFWWGKDSCTPEQFKALFRYTHDYMMEHGSFTNILWAYSPNGVGNDTEEGYLTYYPGDFIRLLGIDFYQYTPTQEYIDALRQECKVMAGISARTGQLIALTEFGFKNCTEKEWYTKAVCEALKGYKISHALTWRNAYNDAPEAFGPYKGKLEEQDFVKAVKEKKFLMLNDIKQQEL